MDETYYAACKVEYQVSTARYLVCNQSNSQLTYFIILYNNWLPLLYYNTAAVRKTCSSTTCFVYCCVAPSFTYVYTRVRSVPDRRHVRERAYDGCCRFTTTTYCCTRDWCGSY